MLYQLPVPIAFLVISVLLLASFWIGTRFSRRAEPQEKVKTSFYVEGTLLSLLISLTFSLSASKYDKRRADFVHEINAMSTTILRARMMPDSAVRIALQDGLQKYVDVRIAYYDVGDDQRQVDSLMAIGDSMSTVIFDLAAKASMNPANLAFTQQFVPTLNTMIDAALTREVFRNAKIPLAVIRLLVVLSMVVAFLLGNNQERGRISWPSAFGYTLLIAMSFALIIDYGHNRTGNINLDKEQQKMIQLRELFD